MPGFFKPVCRQIKQALEQCKCLLTSDNTWSVPFRVIRPRKDFTQRQSDEEGLEKISVTEVIDEALLLRTCNLR